MPRVADVILVSDMPASAGDTAFKMDATRFIILPYDAEDSAAITTMSPGQPDTAFLRSSAVAKYGPLHSSNFFKNGRRDLDESPPSLILFTSFITNVK